MNLFLHSQSFSRRASSSGDDVRSSVSGDTLVEVLVALVIIGLTVVALMGVLTTSVTSSAEYRSLASVDTVLKNFADALKTDVQLQSPATSIYQNCAMSYRVVSEYPSSTVAGGEVTVFGTGFIAGNVVSISLINAMGTPTVIPNASFSSGQTVLPASEVPTYTDGVANLSSTTFTSASANFSLADNGGPINSPDVPSGTTISYVNPTTVTLSAPATATGTNVDFSIPARYGTVAATFKMPTGPSAIPAGLYKVAMSDGSNSSTSPTTLVVGNPPPPPASSAVAGYRVRISSIGWWNSADANPATGLPAFDSPFGTSNPPVPPSPCTTNDDSGIQMIELTATAVNHVTGKLQVVVSNPAFTPPPGPAITVTAPFTSVGSSMTFTATVAGGGGTTPTPTGSVGWIFNSTSPGSPACAPTSLPNNPPPGNSAIATCTIAAAQAGTYQVTANYSGDGNYGFASGFGTLNVGQLTPTVIVSAPPTTVGDSLVFTAKVQGNGGITPTGQVTWTVNPTSPGSPTPTCAPNPSALSQSSPGIAKTSCTISSTAQLSPPPYSINATYAGDANYTPASGSGTATIHTPFTITSVQLMNGGTPGRIDRNDSIVITFSAQTNEGSICNAWMGNTGNPPNDSATVTVSSGGSAANNKLSLTNTDCNLGQIVLGTSSEPPYVTGPGGLIFTGAQISWDSTAFTLTIVLLNGNSGMGNRHTVPSSTPVYTASPSITDSFGDTLRNSPFPLATGQQF